MQQIILSNLFTRSASLLLNFAGVLLVSRWLGPVSKGHVTMLYTSVTLISFLSNILCGQSLIYLAPRRLSSELLLPSYLWAFLTCGVAAFFLHSVSLFPPALNLFIPLISLMAALLNTNQTLLLGAGRFKAFNLNALLLLLLNILLFIGIFKGLGLHDPQAFYLALMGGYTGAFLLSVMQLRPGISFNRLPFKVAGLLSGFALGLRFQLVEILSYLNMRFYFYLLYVYYHPAQLGIYSVGISILESVWLLGRSISTYLISKTSNNEWLEPREILSLIKLSLLFSLVALTIIYAIPGSIYSEIFGPQFRHIKYSVRFLFPGVLIYNVVLVLEAYDLGKGKTLMLMAGNAIGVGISTTLCWWLIPRFVMSGAGLAASAAFTVSSMFLLFNFLKSHQLPLSGLWQFREDVQIFNKWLIRLRG